MCIPGTALLWETGVRRPGRSTEPIVTCPALVSWCSNTCYTRQSKWYKSYHCLLSRRCTWRLLSSKLQKTCMALIDHSVVVKSDDVPFHVPHAYSFVTRVTKPINFFGVHLTRHATRTWRGMTTEVKWLNAPILRRTMLLRHMIVHPSSRLSRRSVNTLDFARPKRQWYGTR